MIPLLLALQVPGVIDRIDGEHAAIEWAAGPVVAVPLDRLPPGVREGARVRLRTGRGRAGALPLPLEVAPRGWRAAVADGTPVRWTITLERT